MKRPQIVGEWKILFQPEKHGDYVNDHTVIKGSDGKWHLYGCTSFSGGPYNERYFAHGVGESLEQPMKEAGRSIDKGTLAWAPCVIEKEGNYYMFYGPSPTQLAVSFDMQEWYGYPVALKNEPIMGAHRDHFVLKLADDKYIMYVAGIYQKKGAISAFSSNDLLHWEFEGFALTSGKEAPLNPGWGAMESPFVVQKDGWFYLLVTYNDCTNETYCNTLVFASQDPLKFGEYNGGKGGAEVIATLHAHAPEVLLENGNYYITTCGWRSKPLPHKGVVSIAKLEWTE